jgi:hypothetical protein
MMMAQERLLPEGYRNVGQADDLRRAEYKLVTKDEPWRKLRIGDRVRFVRIPGEDIPAYHLHAETKRAYRMVIARGRAVRVYEIDDWGIPWVQFRLKDKRGRWEYHSMALNDDSWVAVRPLKRRGGSKKPLRGRRNGARRGR